MEKADRPRLRSVIEDPTNPGRISAGRTPLIVGFILSGLLVLAVATVLIWTHLNCYGTEACTGISYDVFAPFVDRMLDALVWLGGIYGMGKGLDVVREKLSFRVQPPEQGSET